MLEVISENFERVNREGEGIDKLNLDDNNIFQFFTNEHKCEQKSRRSIWQNLTGKKL